MSRRVLILSGGGDYRDPWHQFLETSEAVGVLFAAAGFDVELAVQIDAELAELRPRADEQPALFGTPAADLPDLLVVNAGRSPDDAPPPPDAQAGLSHFLSRGGGLLVLHAGVGLWKSWPVWERLIGGAWVNPMSWHPEFGPTRVLFGRYPHPLTRELGELEYFDTFDEKYCDLRMGADVNVFGWHEYDGVYHPLLWTRDRGTRIAVDVLGHDLRAFGSAEHRALLLAAADWAAG